MTIGTDATIGVEGTQDTLGTSSAAVADAGFSIAGDLSTWINDDDALGGFLILLANFAVAPDANSSINVFIRPLNIQGTNDAEVPDANMQQGYIGSFSLNDVTTAQYPWIAFTIPFFKTSGEFEFYLENDSGQSLPAGWDIYVTPTAPAPHP